MVVEVIIRMVNVLIFLFLSGIHIYWAFGGRWGVEAVLPSKDGVKKLTPSPIGTLVVASGLALFSGVSAIELESYQWVYLAMGIVFGLRVIGDFRYVGLFKRIKDSVFAEKDTVVFIPLCVYLSLSNLFLYFY